MKSAAFPNSARMIAVAFASFACVAAITVFLWRIQPLAAAAVGVVVLLGSAATILRGAGPRQAASLGTVVGYITGSVVALLLGSYGAA